MNTLNRALVLIRMLSPCVLLLHAATVFSAEPTPPPASRAECVGRLQLELPGEVMVASYSFKRLEARILNGGGQPRYEFDDGESAGWSHVNYRSRMFISARLSPEELEQIEKKFVASKSAYEKFLRKLGTTQARAMRVDTVETDLAHVNAWRVDAGINVLLRLDRNMLLTTVEEGDKGLDESRKSLMNLAKSTSYRPLYTIPTGPGVCVPHAFIKDDGKLFRKVGMTYRLIAHPDITIYIEDSGAGVYESSYREENAKPKNVIDSDWAQRVGTTIPMWPLMHKRPITLVGRRGMASFVRFTSDDKSTDYGYMAVVRGDPNAADDRPDVKLHVLRDQRKALAKGIKPLDEKTFLNMAESIAASLRHRSTK